MRLIFVLMLALFCLESNAQVTLYLQLNSTVPTSGGLVANPEWDQPLLGSDHVIGIDVFFLDGGVLIPPDSGYFEISTDDPDCMNISVPDDPDTPENEFLILSSQLSVEGFEGQGLFYLHAGAVACIATVAVSAQLGQQRLTASLRIEVIDPLPKGVIDSRVSGVYYDRDRDGEGVTVFVQTRAGRPHALVTWYTYREGRQLWLIGNADVDGNSVSISLIETSGGDFGLLFDPSSVEIQTWGQVGLDFPECGKLTLNYQEAGGESGTIHMTRIMGTDEGICL